MSTRYVWGRYNATPGLTSTVSGHVYDGEQETIITADEGKLSGNVGTIYFAEFSLWDQNDVSAFKPTGIKNIKTINPGNTTIELLGNGLFLFSKSPINTNSTFPVGCEFYDSDETSSITISWNNISAQSATIKVLQSKIYYSKGALLGDSTSALSGAYPQNGVSGRYWYTYQGSDNIDPTAVSIPSTINGGTAINITVTPGTGKVYGGTVSYQYQVKLGSGEWTTIATTSATTRSYTVPYGTASIQVRVRAKDNLGFTSTTYVTSASVTVINNQPPTAPGSIDVANVVAGQQATITLTAATDPDGTIASYIYERSVDGSAWTQIANVNILTQTDTISADWGTVAYRACAVDDDGASGPYVTSETTTVNSGWVIISGPASDMGNKPAPFDFVFSVSVTGQASVDAINVAVTLDGESIYTGTPNSGVEVSIPIDTRLLAAGEHTVEVQATKESYLEANGSYTFDVPAITLPDGGRAEMLQNPEGDVVFPYTLARMVIGKGGKDLNALLEQAMSTVATLTGEVGGITGEVTELKAGALKMATGSYTGTGTNQMSLTFDFAVKFLFVLQTSDSSSGNFKVGNLVWVGQSQDAEINSESISYTVSNNGKTLTWNGPTLGGFVSNQNYSGYRYSYFAIGQ
jgi:hypothetical protein